MLSGGQSYFLSRPPDGVYIIKHCEIWPPDRVYIRAVCEPQTESAERGQNGQLIEKVSPIDLTVMTDDRQGGWWVILRRRREKRPAT